MHGVDYVRHMHRLASGLAATLLAIAASGCIGATDRADFDAEVRARGGGLTSAWIAEALDLVAGEVSVTPTSELELVTLAINSTDRSVSAQARRGDQNNFVDVVIVKQGEVVAITPVQDADQLPLDDITFTLSQLPLENIETLGDTALREFGEADGFVSRINVSLRDGSPVITVSLVSARRTGKASFTADGTFIEMTR